MPCLKLTTKRDSGLNIFSIFKPITSIGKSPDNDICFPESNLEEHHAQIIYDGRDFMLFTLNGAPEFIINGKERKKSRLINGDSIKIGNIQFIFSVYDETVTLGVPEEKKEKELEAIIKLYQFSQILMNKHDINNLLETLMDYIIELTKADKGFLILIENGKPEVKVGRNINKESIRNSVELLSDTIIAQVVETKQPLIVSDALKDIHFNSSESVINLKLSSVMCVPLLEQGNLLGIIYVGNDSIANLFEMSTLDMLNIFAAQASLIIQNALLLDSMRLDKEELVKELEERKFGEIIGSCPTMLEVYKKIEKVAPTDISVLITGETGTGKELVAREIHLRSERRKGPFVVINCGAIPENLLESELFGYEKGAFTGAVSTRNGKFQTANNGTIFLDEIGELAIQLQVKLLRVLQEKVVVKVGSTKPEHVDIRIIAATNKTLSEEIKANKFREDLFYRLNVVNIYLPGLKERGDDIILIAKYFINKYVPEFNSKVKGFTPGAISSMKRYLWPGNIRELENKIKKAIVMCDKTMIGPEDLDLSTDKIPPILTLEKAKEEFQRKYVLEVLELNNGNRTKTAKDLGVDPRTIFRYLEKETEKEL